MKTKKAMAFLLLILLLCSSFCIPSFGDNPESKLDKKASFLLYHNESGTLLYEKNSKEARSPGPVARLLAAYTLFLHYEQHPEKEILVHPKVTGLASSTMNPGLKPGELLSAYDLFAGFLIANSDDAVFALAFDFYKDAPDPPQALLNEMNTQAKNLSMNDSHFYSITGVDPENTKEHSVTTAADALLLVRKIRENKAFTKLCNKEKYVVAQTNKTEERLLLTRNYLLSALRIPGYVYDKASGLLAFNHESFGYSLVSTADFLGKTFTCIILGAEEEYRPFLDAKTLFEYADTHFAYQTVLKKTEILGEIKVILSKDFDYITVVPKEELSLFLPTDATMDKDLKKEVSLSFSELTAPVNEGLISGTVVIKYKGTEIGRADLVTSGSLSLSTGRYYLSLMQNFFRSTPFIVMAVLFILLLIAYIFINARVRFLRSTRPAALHFEEEKEETEEAEERPLFLAFKEKKQRKKSRSKKGKEQEEPSFSKQKSKEQPPLPKEEGEEEEDVPKEEEQSADFNRENATDKDFQEPQKNILFDNPYSDLKDENKEQKPQDGEYIPEGWGE